jgi:hypothetical protein
VKEPVGLAANLNRNCDCSATDVPALRVELDAALCPDLALSVMESHPHLFSAAPVFIDASHLLAMQELIDVVYAVTRLPGYELRALAAAPEIASRRTAALGAFTAFDFHITADGPRLIEINTNAGGALLNAAARRAQPPCCPGYEDRFRTSPDAGSLENAFVAMFEHEWQLVRGAAPLRSIAIVDEHPERQYLYPEFLLFRNLFQAHGYDVVIADPRDLTGGADGLACHGHSIDLVYNRLTDFYLEQPANRALRLAYESGSAVITPHPRAHALLASKRNLALLTDTDFLNSIAARPSDAATMKRVIPTTHLVDTSSEAWWNDRKRWFFKPVDGFGSRGGYRGNKMTRRVFAEIARGGYVAQEFTPPGERWRTREGHRETFKVDTRAYVYDGVMQLVAARLYQGQTTNFRTAGGGFAPVYVPLPGGKCA